MFRSFLIQLGRRILKPPQLRPMIEFLKNREQRNLVGVEIGVEQGLNAESMLKHLNIKTLFLVDPYAPYKTSYGDYVERDNELFLQAKENLAKYRAKIVFVRKTSEDAINTIPNGLDYVYIDGNHDYEHVKKDIQFYYPKIKKCGVIGGHDFRVTFLGVCRAVLEFVEKNNLKLEGKGVDWWIVKK